MSETSPLRYRALYELGRGGMGLVELAEAEGLGLVAIKRILPDRAGDERARTEFLREARLLARIDHPQVVRVLAIDPGDPPVLFMEHIDGLSLREVLTQGPLPPDLAAGVARDLALGLHAAHELRDEQGKALGLVHRDVSPHNVLLTFDGEVKLLDFGVAKTTEGTRTVTGEVKGKIAYMSPEQALGEPVDRRSDLHALGALLYEALSGRRMYGEGTDLEVLRRIITEKPAPLASLCPGLDPGLITIVARLCSASPDERPATAAEVAELLTPHAAPPGALGAWMQQLFPLATQARRARIEAALAALHSPTPLAGPLSAGPLSAVSGPLSAVSGPLPVAHLLVSSGAPRRASAGAESAPTLPPPPRPGVRAAAGLGAGVLALALAGVGWRATSGAVSAPSGVSSGPGSASPLSVSGESAPPPVVSGAPSASSPAASPVRAPLASSVVRVPARPVILGGPSSAPTVGTAAPPRPVNSTRIDERPF